MRNLLVVVLVLALSGCCMMKKSCPMKNHEAMPAEAMVVPEPVAAVEEVNPAEVVVEVPVTEESTTEVPAMEAPVAQ